MELVFGIGALALLAALAYGVTRSRRNAPVSGPPIVRSRAILTVLLVLIAGAAIAYFISSFFVLDEVNPRSSSMQSLRLEQRG